MKALLCLLVILPLSVAMADQGDPDAYGYRWIDNDNGGGPAYNWIDITQIGTQLTGLGDDDNVGPFPLGFNFIYYGNVVNRCWISTNGYISFSSGAYFDPPFEHHIPDHYYGHTLVAALGGDLDFTYGNGRLYYYSNNIDSFIVSWISVSEFRATDSLHTFQLILSARDSSLSSQYGENHGDFRQGDIYNEPANIIGVQNSNGTVGLEYLWHNLPSSHRWHFGLALRFYPVYWAHDIGIIDGINEGSKAILVPIEIPFNPRVLVKNLGNLPDVSISVLCQIRRGSRVYYNQVANIEYLGPGDSLWADYPYTFTPDMYPSDYEVTFSTTVPWDRDTTNDSIIMELDSYQLPQVLKYVDNSAESGRSWDTEFSGFGTEFQIPDAIRVRGLSFYAKSIIANGTAYALLIMGDSLGYPNLSNIVEDDTFIVVNSGWYSITFDNNQLYLRPEQKFYAVIIIASPGTFQIGMDRNLPFSNRGWEYVQGIFSPDSNSATEDIMIGIMAEASGNVWCPYIPGDINSDDAVTAQDVSYAVNYFRGSTPPPDICHCRGFEGYYAAGDVNGSCSFNGLDICYMVHYFHGGPLLRYCPSCLPAQ